MTNAGTINRDWLDNCRTNECDGERLEDWICRAGNFCAAKIDDDGAVWVESAAGGYWLDQGAIDDLCRTIDAGV